MLFREKSWNVGDREAQYFTSSHREVVIWRESHMQSEPLEAKLGLLVLLFWKLWRGRHFEHIIETVPFLNCRIKDLNCGDMDQFLYQIKCISFYTGNQWKRNTCIFDIFLTLTCLTKFCFHQTTVLYIFYQKIILYIDWLSKCIV